MIAIKLLGALLILGTGTVCAYCSVRYEKKKLRILDGWIDLIGYIRSCIDCYLMPLCEILTAADAPVPDLQPSCREATDLHAILGASSVYLDGDAKRLLEGFVREIGTSYREEQVKRCDYYVGALHALREKYAQELPVRMRLSVTVSLCISLGAAVLLW